MMNISRARRRGGGRPSLDASIGSRNNLMTLNEVNHAGLSICHFCGSWRGCRLCRIPGISRRSRRPCSILARAVPRRQLWVPLALLAASDVILTKFVYSYQFSWDHFVTWAWYAAILWLGTGLRENTNWLRVGGSRPGQFRLFFVVSNFAVWACWNMYPKDLLRSDDLLRCRPSILPPRASRRHALHRRHVRIARAGRDAGPQQAAGSRSRRQLDDRTSYAERAQRAPVHADALHVRLRVRASPPNQPSRHQHTTPTRIHTK